MAFDYLMTPRGLEPDLGAARRQAMYVAELAQRAALYHRLQYSRERAIARLRQNVAWDFEIGGAGSAPTDADIASVVAAAYQR